MALKEPDPDTQKGLTKLPTEVRNKMGYMKKGGKVKKKRYEEGGEIELESKMGRNENIGDDVRERAMAAMAARESGSEEAEPAKPKAESKPKSKAEPKVESKAEPKKKPSTTIDPSTFGRVSLPKSFSESGGNTEPKKSTAKFRPPNISLPDPLAKFKKMASGGKVSSASKRADGCAQRGKTRA